MLSRAHSPEDPDWRILSAQGAALDQLGRGEEARQYYASALRIAPDEPSVLSNLALSYVLSKDLPRAEQTLRRAYSRADADPRVRQNLALVLGLRGHLAEAEGIMKEGVPPEEAAAAVKAFHPRVVIPYHYRGSDLAVFRKGLEGTGIEIRTMEWYPS